MRSRGLPAGHRGDVRLVEIVGVDLNTCGGTHLASTAEIESLKLLGTEPMRGGTRLYWVAGGRVRRLLADHEARSARLRGLFECCDEELVSVAGSRLQGLREAEHRARILEVRLAESAAESLANCPERVLEAHFEGLGAGYLRRVARRLLEHAPDRAALLTASDEGAAFFLLVAGEGCPVDVQFVGRRVAELLAGRGGGSKRIFQGKVGSLARRPKALALLERALESGTPS